MPAYFLVDIREIKDAAKIDEYRSRVAPTVEKFGGRYPVRGRSFEVVEGTYQPVRLAMLGATDGSHLSISCDDRRRRARSIRARSMSLGRNT